MLRGAKISAASTRASQLPGSDPVGASDRPSALSLAAVVGAQQLADRDVERKSLHRRGVLEPQSALCLRSQAAHAQYRRIDQLSQRLLPIN